MAYTAEVDLLVHLHSFSTLLLKKQGLAKVRLFLWASYVGNKQLTNPSLVRYRIFAHPFSIIKGNKAENHKFDSFIDESTHGYYSRAIQVYLDPDYYVLAEACLFRLYLPVYNIDSYNIFCYAELLYSPDNVENDRTRFDTLGNFECRIRKISRLADFLPISFDDFYACSIKATFHSTILEYKFVKQYDDVTSTYYDFWSEVERQKIKNFYTYYRKLIEEEFASLQENLSSMVKGCRYVDIRIQAFRKNTKLEADIDWLANVRTSAFNIASVNKIIYDILLDFTQLKGYCYDLWNKYIEYLMQRSGKIALNFHKTYRQKVVDRLKAGVFSHMIKGADLARVRYEGCGQFNLMQAYREKAKTYDELWHYYFPIENINYFADHRKAVKLFYEVYIPVTKVHEVTPIRGSKILYSSQSVGNFGRLSIEKTSPCIHVFVLVHGFQASHKDFTLVKNYLLAREQPTEVLLSIANEGRTSMSIYTQAGRLALEISDFLSSRMCQEQYKISFIGHSMGGVIVRAAVKYLERFWPYFHSYISLSSPHLGYLNNCSTIMEAGLWYLNNWEKCDSVRELMMIDQPDPTKSFLFRLASEDSLRKFQKVALVSSFQDGFVPHDSARIEKSYQLIMDAQRGNRNAQLVCHMTDSILSKSVKQLHRIDVVFQIDERNIDSLVGRTGHIKFLSDSHFLKTFVNTFDSLFQ